MRGVASTLAMIVASTMVSAQTYSDCNPLQQSCPADKALGTAYTEGFSSGKLEKFQFKGGPGNLNFDSSGAHLLVKQSGDSPMLVSDFYIMFGRVDVEMQAAPGIGIVSSIVLESDVLDEVDWEFLGGDTARVQSNYFGKGFTGNYDRGAFHPVSNPQTGMHTYSIDWTSQQINWIIDGTVIRTLTYDAANGGNNFPQTPMKVKLGVWAGGDPSNAPGVVQWAGGATDYGSGPYNMIVKSCKVADYSSGTEYRYTDNSGSWKSIQAAGGAVYTAGSPNGNVAAAAPSQTKQQVGVAVPPAPFSNSFRTETAENPKRTGWPWEANGDKTPKFTKASGSGMSDKSGDAEAAQPTYNNGFYTPYSAQPSAVWPADQAAQTAVSPSKMNSMVSNKQKSGAAAAAGMNRAHAYPIIFTVLSVFVLGYIL